jgi:hypothetical protein
MSAVHLHTVVDVIHEHDDISNSLQFGCTLFVQICPIRRGEARTPGTSRTAGWVAPSVGARMRNGSSAAATAYADSDSTQRAK